MYRMQPTWIEYGPMDGAIKGLCGGSPRQFRRGRMRGVGDTCVVGSTDPTTGDTVAYCPPAPPAASPVVASGSTCFTAEFPWVGSSVGGVCTPVFSVPSPWGLVITAGLAGLFALKLFGGRR
jgi:hypothetical protein